MITARINDKKFMKAMTNIVRYSEGFLDGVQSGKKVFLDGLGKKAIEAVKLYIDSNARVQPLALQHVYEWDKAGSPAARLFDIEYTVSNLGLSLSSTFRQSSSIKSGSKVPFYDKARIMENGIPVTIRPKSSNVLAFNENGETIFTKGPVVVQSPGGTEAQGGFQKAFDSFFRNYFSQAFLRSSGILNYLENPRSYKKNLRAGKAGGKSVGISTGYRWIINAAGVR